MTQIPKTYSLGFHVGMKQPYFTDIPGEDCIDFETAIKSIKLLAPIIPADESSKTVALYFGGGCSSKHFPLIRSVYEYLITAPICNLQSVALDISTDGYNISTADLDWLRVVKDTSIAPTVAFSVRTSNKNIDAMLNTFKDYSDLIDNPHGLGCVAYYVDEGISISTIIDDLDKLARAGFSNGLILPPNTYCSALIDCNDERWAAIFAETTRWYLSVRDKYKFRLCLYDRYYKLIHEGPQKAAWFSQCGIFLSPDYSHTYTLASGIIYPCSGSPHAGDLYSIGHVDTGFNWTKVKELRANITTCNSCSISEYCFKGCYIVEKCDGESSRFSCKMQKIIFDEIKRGMN